jgi:hypothetical protein
MKFAGKVDWWERDLTHNVISAVLADDHLSIDLEYGSEVWIGKMNRSDANRYVGHFQTRGGKKTAEASGYLRGTGNERLLIGEWLEDGVDCILVIELQASSSN